MKSAESPDPFLAVAEHASRGRKKEACELALDIAKGEPTPENCKKALQQIVSNSHYSGFAPIVDLCAGCIESICNDAAAMEYLGYACWVVNQHELAIACLNRLIALNPQIATAYRTLALIHLEAGRSVDAFIVAHAGIQLTGGDGFIRSYLPLVYRRAAGHDTVDFEFDGETYTFRLGCFNGQAIDAHAYHCNGSFMEHEELAFLKKWLPPVGKIVECGCLVGNHTVFFLRNLKPREIALFDANPRALAEIAENVRLNDRPELSTSVNLNHRAIASRSGDVITLLGNEVETISLADAITEDTDFVKIDIDGMELESLDGLVEGLRKSRAWLMIEVLAHDVPEFVRRLGAIGYQLDHEITRSLDHNLFFRPKP